MSYPTIDQSTEGLDEQGLLYQRGDAPLAAGARRRYWTKSMER